MKDKKSYAKKDKHLSKDLLLNLLRVKFNEHPEIFREYLPEIVELMETSLKSREGLFANYLTERERQARLNSLIPILEQCKKGGSLAPEEAVRALEDAAALKEHIPDKEAIIRMVLDVFRIDKESDKKETIRIRNDLKKGQSYSLAKGIVLVLSWDGKLLAIEIDGKELARRQKTLAFVGIAKDPRSDVAEHHDTYAWEAFE